MSIVTISRDNGVASLTLDDGKANVLNEASLRALEEALDDTQDEGAVVLKGRDGLFCGGLDLKTLPLLDPAGLKAVLNQFGRLCLRLLTYPRPTLAAVNGHAIAGGAVLLLCCDQRIGCRREMKVGLSEVAIGMPLPTFVVRLAELSLPREVMGEAVLHGRLYGVEEASRVRFLHQAVDAAEFEEQVMKAARGLAKLPNPAYQLTKQRFQGSIEESLRQFEEEMSFFFTPEAQAHAARFKG